MTNKYVYGSLFRFGTLQFDGHVHDYFVSKSGKLVEFYILARGGKEKNFIAVYSQGLLIEKKLVYSPTNIFLAYGSYYFHYVFILFHYFSRHEHFYVINSLPIFFFFHKFWQLFRKFEIVYWIQDYWPMDTFSIRIIRYLIHFYHKKSRKSIYITDRVNKIMNGRVVNYPDRHTVMLGTSSPRPRKIPKNGIVIAFIGVLKESQGIPELLHAVSMKKDVKLNLIGTGDARIVSTIKKLITKYKIQKQVFFPNKFLYKEELEKAIDRCHIGVVMYEESPTSVTYYADPAKLKQYAEFGFPIITTNTSEISHYIKKYHAGEIIRQDSSELLKAIEKIQKSYSKYTAGLTSFCEYFSFNQYFDKKFLFLTPNKHKIS